MTELKRYCENDVFILMEACDRFKQLFREITGLDVFRESITIASACNKVFRKNFLKANQIPIIPQNGYRLRNNQSKVGLKWLYWLQHSRGLTALEHSGNGRERRLLEKFFVDGFDPNGGQNKTGKVYEMLGCYWHQCPNCYGTRAPTVSNVTKKGFEPQNCMSIRYEETMNRINILKKHYEVEYIWECQFKEIRRSDAYKEFEKENKHLWEVGKLIPRDAFFGGRTNNTKLYKKAENGEKIFYKDVTSLYPYINKTKSYPLYSPKKIYHGSNISEVDVLTMNGVIKLEILPPDDLDLPVLPQKMHDKLLFYLCHECAKIKNQTYCDHADEQRSFIGTFIIDEVREALKMGYKIIKIFEFWQYDIIQRSEDGSEPGLFDEYVNTFLRVKQQASGYPNWVQTQADKDEYIRSYKEKEGIDLDPSKIEYNESLRSLAKLCLNNFWGKFGEKEGKRSTVIIKDRQTLMDYVSNPRYKIECLIPIDDEVLLLHYINTLRKTQKV
jgi:hypothetical protein